MGLFPKGGFTAGVDFKIVTNLLQNYKAVEYTDEKEAVSPLQAIFLLPLLHIINVYQK